MLKKTRNIFAIIVVLIAFSISVKAQSYSTPAPFIGSDPFSPTWRSWAGTTDSLNNFSLNFGGNKNYQIFTASQINYLLNNIPFGMLADSNNTIASKKWVKQLSASLTTYFDPNYFINTGTFGDPISVQNLLKTNSNANQNITGTGLINFNAGAVYLNSVFLHLNDIMMDFTPGTSYNLMIIADSVNTPMLTFLNGNHHASFNYAGHDMGYQVGVNGTFGTNSSVTFSGLPSGTPTNGSVGLDASNHLITFTGGGGGYNNPSAIINLWIHRATPFV